MEYYSYINNANGKVMMMKGLERHSSQYSYDDEVQSNLKGKTMKTTLATIKSFIKKNQDLYINCKSRFDGMVDCVMPNDNSQFHLAKRVDSHKNTLGIAGAWFVFGSRDYFREYEDAEFKGYEVYNCCGSFILATKKGA